jgi:hypothetical protein
MPVANVAHGAGAVIGWLFGRAVLTHRPVLGVANASLFCLALALLTLYMPWDGKYDFHRGSVCGDREDYAGAEKWFERAAERLTGENQERARHNVRWARYMQQQQREKGE